MLRGNGGVFFLMATLILACDPAKPGSLKVTNGIISDAYPGIVYIKHIDGQCSGTFIRPDVILTAAHCIGAGAPVVVPQFSMASAKIVIHPEYNRQDSTNDLALVFFAKPLSEAVHKVQYEPSSVGSRVTLVGFGNNSFLPGGIESIGGTGEKRVGTNTIAAITDQFLTLAGVPYAKPEGASEPSGVASSAAHGDSGGPLLNEGGEVIGVANFVGRNDDGTISSNYANLGHFKQFIDENLADSKNFSEPAFVENCRTHPEAFELKAWKQQKAPPGSDIDCDSLYFELSLRSYLFLLNGSGASFDLASLKELQWLRYLTLSGYSLVNAEAFAAFKDLRTLDLMNTGIRDLSVLAGNLKLESLSITAAEEISLEPLKTLPRLAKIVLNGTTVPGIRSELLGGTWTKPCSTNMDLSVNPDAPLFMKETWTYTSSTNTVATHAEVFTDENCNGKLVAAFSGSARVDAFYPLKDKDVYALDLFALPESRILINDESRLPAEQMDMIKQYCEFALNTEMKCKLEIQPFDANFTIVKFSGGSAYFGVEDDAEEFDGISESARFRELDDLGYQRQVK